jgi:quinol monooxygenase YgiN
MITGDQNALLVLTFSMRFPTKRMDSALQLLLSEIQQIQAKHGCLSCTLSLDISEEGLIYYREEWVVENSFQKHIRSEEFHRILVAMDLCAEEPRIMIGSLKAQFGMEFLHQLHSMNRDETGHNF